MRMKIVGHKRQNELLSLMAMSGEIPHAMIFEGPSKLGKRSLSVDFIRKVFCETKNGCGECQSCKDILNNRHPDLISISPQGKDIQISQIRDLSRKFSFKPYSAPFKATIIDDAHLMNQESQNSILKLLEEPGGESIMILVTDYPEALLATVRSRSRRIPFFPVNEKDIVSCLRDRGCDAKLSDEITLFSFGRPGVAIDFFLDPSRIENRREGIKNLLNVISSDSPFRMRFRYAKELAEDSGKTKETLEMWLSYFRALMIKKAEGVKGIKYSLSKIKSSLEAIEKSIYLVSRTNANTKMVLEKLIMEL